MMATNTFAIRSMQDRFGPAGYWRARGMGQDTSVTSEIISPGDPRYIDLYPNVAGGGVVYPTSDIPYYLAAPGGTQGSTAGTSASPSQTGSGTSATGTTATGIFGMYGPFTGSGGGSGFSPLNTPLINTPNLQLPDLCSKIFGTGTAGKTICGGNLFLYLLIGAGAILLLVLVKR